MLTETETFFKNLTQSFYTNRFVGNEIRLDILEKSKEEIDSIWCTENNLIP